jgi:Flp pilus assembly protein CpaB
LTVARFRRPLALILILAAVWITARLAAPPLAPTVAVAVAGHDLPAGHRLTPDDVRVVQWPADTAPARRIAGGQAAGRTLATALTAGDAITDPRLLGPGLLTGQPPGTVAVTVRVADPASLSPVSPGNRIDVLAGPASSWDPPLPAAQDLSTGDQSRSVPSADSRAARGPGAERVATRAIVLATTPARGEQGIGGDVLGLAPASSTPGSAGDGGVLIVAVDAATASRLAAVASSRPLSVVLLSA